MENSDYFKFCHDAFRNEFRERDHFYTKYALLTPAVIVLGTVVVRVGRLDILPQLFERVDYFALYFGALFALLSLSTAILLLMVSLFPREYESMGELKEYDLWRAQVREVLESSEEEYAEDEIETIVSAVTRSELTRRMNDATAFNFGMNAQRAMYYNWALYMVSAAIILLAIELLASLAIHVQETA